MRFYDDALRKRCKWKHTQAGPSLKEATDLKLFANQWSSHMHATGNDVWQVLSEELPTLNKLQDKTIMNVCFDETIGESVGSLIDRCFKKLANCNRKGRNEATGASKILHMINPGLFLMWDEAIIRGYGGHVERLLYTDFLRRMQVLAKCAIKQVKEKESHHSDETAIASLTGCKYTLAKTLDEYNFMKFTKNCDAVWKAEYESCNSP